jgi:predicted RNA-binding protein with PIN domain
MDERRKNRGARPIPEGTYIIDGYNLLRRAFASWEKKDEVGTGREKLEVRLREFRRSAGPEVRIVLIYDGVAGASADIGGPRSDPGFRVLFSLPPSTADDAVLAECRRLSGAEEGPITVVTSDMKDIARAMRGLRARHMTSEDFADLLDAALARPPAPPGPEKPRRGEKPEPEEMAPGEVARWIEAFSTPKPKGKPRPGRGR